MLLLVAVHGIAHAATLTVGPSGRDFTTIAEAIAVSAEGDRIEIDSGTYAESVVIGKSLTLVGTGSLATFLTGAGPVINVTDGTVALEGLTLAPSSERGLEVRQATLSLTDITVTGGQSTLDAGGGLYAVESTLTLADSSFQGNVATTFHGGHLYAYASTTTITGTTFAGGRAEKGGALYAIGGTMDIEGSTFSANEVRADDESSRGGAIRAQDVTLTITDSDFDANGAENGYGGAIATYGGDLVVEGSTFTGHTVTEFYGGAIALYDTDATLTDSVFTENTALLSEGAGYGHGGAILVYGTGVATFAMTGSTFTDNFAEGFGGAMRIETGSASIADSTFTTNLSGYGGAMHLQTVGAVGIDDSTFTGNEAPHGGAIRWRPSSSAAGLTIRGSTFTGNIASAGYGGSLFAYLGGSVEITDTSFTGNNAVIGGALMIQAIDRVTAKRNLFCGNEAAGDASSDGGAVTVYQSGGGGSNRWTNNVFAENKARVYGGALNQVESVTAYIANNTFLENEAATMGGGAAFRATSGMFVNNLVAWSAGNGLTADATSVIPPTYGDFYDNVADSVGDALDPTLIDASNLKVEPALAAYTANGDCSDDLFWLQATSPLLDAGDPAILDPDGSRSDIGAFGGPDADTSLYTDTDGDGWVDVQDCAREDETIYPGAIETPYDGIDQDCDGADELDVDDDAWEAVEAGGEDCDDHDVTVNPGAEDAWYDGVDSDCDGRDDYDQDGDGHATPAGGGADCADLDPAMNPTAEDVVGDGIDSNCDGQDGTVGGSEEDPETKEGCNCDGSGGAGHALLGLIGLLAIRRRNA